MSWVTGGAARDVGPGGRAVLITFVLVLASAGGSRAARRYQLRNSVSPRATASRWLRAAVPDESFEMSLALRLRNTDQLAALIAEQQDPRSPSYHRWLTPDQFAARFAPLPEQYDAVVGWLQAQGFAVRPKTNGLRIDFGGTVRRVEDSFGVRMGRYRERGRSPLANEDAPMLPVEFRDIVDFVRLNTFPLAEPLVRLPGGGEAMAPPDMYVAYSMKTLLDAGVNGSGQTIAIVARSDFNLSDIADFEQQFGVPLHDPVKVFPSANPGVGAPNGVCRGIRNSRQLAQCINGEETEVVLDTEWASAMAPAATVLVDVSGVDIDQSLMDIVTNHPEAKTIVISFGACERLDSSDLNLFAPMYAEAAVQGQSVLVSTGDGGADGCQDGRGRSVNVLASDPNVTAVGGTALNPGFDANGDATGHVSESVWNDAAGASGGGASTLVSKPAYQNAPGVPDDGSRDQPDVSLVASPHSPGYVVVVAGATEVIGGTSAAAPSWAGIAALLNQALQANGFGPLNTVLYDLGRQQYAGSGARVFHDITQGNNSFDGVVGYVAGPGYDLASGLGSPDVAVLAAVLSSTPRLPTPTSTPTASVTPSRSRTPTHSPSATPTASPTPLSTLTPTIKPSPTRSVTAIASATVPPPSHTPTIIPASTPTATATPSSVAGDANCDGRLSVADLTALVLQIGTGVSCGNPVAGASDVPVVVHLLFD